MKTLTLTLALLFAIPTPAIAATVLTPPITSEPCTPIQTPNGTMCAPKMSQRRNFAPRMEILGGVIRTSRKTDAKRLCYELGGTHLIPLPDEDRAWQCIRYLKRKKS
jgi:hypothetical protein